VVAAAGDQGPAGGRRGQSENDPHRGGLARAVRAEEAGHPSRADGEAQVVNRGDRAEALAEPLHLDHAGPPISHAWRSRSSKDSTVTAFGKMSAAVAGNRESRSPSGSGRAVIAVSAWQAFPSRPGPLASGGKTRR